MVYIYLHVGRQIQEMCKEESEQYYIIRTGTNRMLSNAQEYREHDTSTLP